MARGNQNSLLGFSLIALFALLFSVGFLSTVHAQSDQDPLQENYGTGMSITASANMYYLPEA
jgi:heat shock protein 5